MTKQQPSATRWSLSNVCRMLMGLGFCKIMLFTALGLGYSLPDFSMLTGLWHKVTATLQQPVIAVDGNKPNVQAVANAVALQVKSSTDSVQPKRHDAQVITNRTAVEPQGSAAVRAAIAYTDNKKKNNNPEVRERMPQSPASVTNAQVEPLKAQAPKPEDLSWWHTLDISSLPIPRLGVAEVAYAATLDTKLNTPPPPPSVADGASFSPPEQNILPLGTAGPQSATVPPYNPLVPNENPPAPNINAYVPPEDPIRKEQELARREQEILTLKRQMEERLKELQAAERKVQDMLTEAKTVEGKKMSGLVDMYVNMKPRQAGAALEKLDEGIAAKILVNMKSKQAGEILSYMNPIKTAKITELLTRMRIGQ